VGYEKEIYDFLVSDLTNLTLYKCVDSSFWEKTTFLVSHPIRLYLNMTMMIKFYGLIPNIVGLFFMIKI